MRYSGSPARRLSTAILLAAFTLTVSSTTQAQRSGGTTGGGNTGGTVGGGTPTRRSAPPPRVQPRTPQTLFLFGQVVVEGGSAPTERALVKAQCGATRASGYTDSKGFFSLTITSGGGFNNTNNASGMFDVDDSSLQPIPSAGGMTNCEMKADLPGFLSSRLFVTRRDTLDTSSVGTIILTPFGKQVQEGDGTVSVTSLQVPKDARKEYEKAISKIEDKKFEDAEKRLRKAVEIYPKYAAAWTLLGDVQGKAGRLAEARSSYQNAVSSDAAFVPPYLRLAVLASSEKQWDEVIRLMNTAISKDPTHFPQAYLYSAMARLSMNQVAEAEQIAQRAVSVDKDSREPRLHLLLAEVCSRKGKANEEADHLRAYLKAAPESEVSTKVKQRLDELDKAPAQAAQQ